MSEMVGSSRTTRVLAILFILLSTLTVWQFIAGRSTQSDVDIINRQLARLCETGVIDCTGTPGLPGPKGTPGTGIASVTCDETGQFRIEFTNGRESLVGDCAAADGIDGTDGASGPRGPQGKPGPRGTVGPRGQSCVDAIGIRHCRGPRGPQGKPGKSCVKQFGLEVCRGPQGSPGHGNDITRADIRKIVESILGPYVTKGELAQVVQQILDEVRAQPHPPARK